MTEEILIAGSTAKMAELVAKEIYNIRESKNSLTRGQADYMPKDGVALKLMLDNLDEQEQAMMQMFAGTTDRIEKSFTIRIKPEADMKEKVAFRFSKKLGMLDADNLSGEPYYISIINQETLPPMDPKGKEKRRRMVLFTIFREKLRLPYSLQTNVILTENYLLHNLGQRNV